MVVGWEQPGSCSGWCSFLGIGMVIVRSCADPINAESDALPLHQSIRMFPERLLLSAFVCGPDHGSEPGVGWAWAIHATKYVDEVWVVTRAGGRAAIDAFSLENPLPPNLHFLFVEEAGIRGPAFLKRFLSGSTGLYLTNLMWQWSAYRAVAIHHRRRPFSAVRHVTFAGIRAPSFMGRLGIPFVFGPVGGGERAPWCLRRDFGVGAWLSDAVRDIWNFAIRFDPLMRKTFSQAERIYVTSEQTATLVPSRWRGKVTIQPAIAVSDPEVAPAPRLAKHDDAMVILFLGRFLAWKGMSFGIRAFAEFAACQPTARLIIVGEGPAEWRWRRLSDALGTTDRITWLPRVPQSEVPDLFRQSDVLLFPSLHDSGGMVVLEAMQHGLPVVCLDIGGPGIFVDENCGRVIETKYVSPRQLVSNIAKSLIELADPSLRLRLGEHARERSRTWIWSQKIEAAIARSFTKEAREPTQS
jgi:glycosyltransferase involved in cell wall biosynthesis